MPLETTLLSAPADLWTTGQAIVFDWYDGPRAGVCRLSNPGGEFSFNLLDERPNPDDLDDRLFRLGELPPGTVAEVLSFLRDLGGPTAPVWVPIWSFPDESARRQAEEHLDRALAGARPTPLIVATRDMIHFLGCWRSERTGHAVTDWFSALGIL